MKRLCVLSFLVTALFLPGGLFAQQAAQLPAIKQEAVEEVDKLQTLTQQMVDEIFSFSELGFQEYETSRYVTGILGKNGFHVEQGVAGVPTAWVATYGSGKPVIAFITDIDCIPRASQKPGVAYHDPIIEGAPGHGEGHNSGMAVNVTAALVLKKLMDEHHIAGTIKLIPGVAEELLGTKAFYVRAGLFKDVDLVLGAHVESEFSTSYGTGNGEWSGLVSVQYFFHGKAAHAAAAPWEGRSALDAVELMDTGWDFRREHLRPAQRSHRVIINGGDQPNVVPSEAAVWYYFRELDYPHIKDLYGLGNTMADSAAKRRSSDLPPPAARRTTPATLAARLAHAVIEPLRDFLTRRGAPLILAFVARFKLGEAMAGIMTAPFYRALGFSREAIAATGWFSLGGTLAGSARGGWLVARLGTGRALLRTGWTQTIVMAMYLLLAVSAGEHHVLYATVTTEAFAQGMADAAFITYLSGLCSREFTATHYALLSSLAAIAVHTIGGVSGVLAERVGWVEFYALCMFAALPSMALMLVLLRRQKAAA